MGTHNVCFCGEIKLPFLNQLKGENDSKRLFHDQFPLKLCGQAGIRISGPKVIKHFFMLNSAEHEIFSANKYENANKSWHFHIYKQRKFHSQLCIARKTLQLLVI